MTGGAGTDLETSPSTIRWFVNNPVAANLIMIIVLLIGGLMAMFFSEKNLFPAIRFDDVIIEVPVPGASPIEIENGVLVKIEDAIKNVEGVGEVYSKAVENLGIVQVKVRPGADGATVMDELNSSVNSISGFPKRAETPKLRRAAAEGYEVITVQITGDQDQQSMLRLFKEIRQELLRIPGIERAEIEEATDLEIAIEVAPDQLQRHSLSIGEIVTAIKSHSLDMAGGSLKTDRGDTQIRTLAQAYQIDDFKAIPIRELPDGARIYIGDVATVEERFTNPNHYTLFDGKSSFSLMISSIPGQSILKVSEAVNAFVDKKNAELPDNIQLACWVDSSPYLDDRINLMLRNLGFGALLVFLVLLVFLQLRLAFWVIVGIPVAFCGAFLLMPLFGVSINMISIFGFILVLGVVVDDAIVIAENIHTSVEQNGPGRESVISGARQVAIPATFGVLTTIIAFIPMTLVSGSFGAIWMSIGVVVILSLVFSLVESKWILPAHLRHLRKDSGQSKSAFDSPRLAVDRMLKSFIQKVYQPLLKLALDFRYATLAIFVVIFALTITALGTGLIRFVFFPDLPSDFLVGQMQLSSSSKFEDRTDGIAEIEKALWALDSDPPTNIQHIRTRVLNETEAQIFVEMTPAESRRMNAHELAAKWSQTVAKDSPEGITSFTAEASFIEGAGAAINIELLGSDIDELKRAGDELKNRLAKYEGVFNAQNSLTESNSEWHVALAPGSSASGLTIASVSQQIRERLYGTEAQRVQRGDNEIKVMVRYPVEDRKSINQLKQTTLVASTGKEVPFNQAVELSFASGFSSLERVNGLRVARVTASVDKQFGEPGKIVAAVAEGFSDNVLKPEFPGVEMRLAGQSQEEINTVKELAQGFVIAILAIYALMAIPLRSYIQPLMIMSIIPFGFIGAVVGHVLLGLPFSVLSLCGIIALAGVVVNDSLVFVDFVNRGRDRGLTAAEAARQAGSARFRAILLTSLTTFIGLIPIILEKSMQATPVIPMAVTLAFGILFSTVITLLLLPTLYLIIEDIQSLWRKPDTAA